MAAATDFEELPLSTATTTALKNAGFMHMTAVQRACIPHGLCGRDVLGAAKTGSGKTLAFLVPAMERLFRHQWTSLDGLGVLVLTPTRELALQVFSNLRTLGAHHPYSGAVLIGGKDVLTEKNRVAGVNVLVCTPGRLLQHMDETPYFDCSSLQCLVIDEADRTLDMGFKPTLDAILENVRPSSAGRQTMLFSATQGRDVGSLARLSLRDPEYIAVHAEAETATPAQLTQLYTEIPLESKLEMLWSFIKSHLGSKTLVFLSTCREAQFVHEAFRQLRPGITVRTIHGRVKQKRRLTVYDEFCKAKNMVLFATDIAARGLDFPAVDWVVQVDCPESADAYIHRVGRTARFKSNGKALLMLLPSELKMVEKLTNARVPIKRIEMNARKRQPISSALRTLLSKNAQLKHFAQKAVSSYVRGVHLSGDHEVFSTSSLPVAAFAESLGLQNPPRLLFLRKRVGKRAKLNEGNQEGEDHDGNDTAANVANGKPDVKETKSGGYHATAEDYDERTAKKRKRTGNNQEITAHERSEGVVRGNTDEDPTANQLRSGATRRLLAMDESDDDETVGDERTEDPEQQLHMKSAPSADDGALLHQKASDAQVAEQVPAQKPVKPPRRLKIKAGGIANRTGTKTVFTEEGEELPPLAKVSAGVEKGVASDQYVQEAQQRFQRLAHERAKMDEEDRQREKQRVKKKHERIREKKKKESDDMMERNNEQNTPVLGEAGDRNISTRESSEGETAVDWRQPAVHKEHFSSMRNEAGTAIEVGHMGMRTADPTAAPGEGGLSELEKQALSKLRSTR